MQTKEASVRDEKVEDARNFFIFVGYEKIFPERS